MTDPATEQGVDVGADDLLALYERMAIIRRTVARPRRSASPS